MVLFFVGRCVVDPDVRAPLLLVRLVALIEDLGLVVIEPEAIDIHRVSNARLVVMLFEVASVLMFRWCVFDRRQRLPTPRSSREVSWSWLLR